ncbi:MAG: hypothetical protein KAH31_11865 [Candidatus Sabulitectum sp.]|nr:hypothetical protein [Candidatus Sabulitectum sp.]
MGFFVSGFAETSILFREIEEAKESVSLCFKFGWKQELSISGFPVSIEPNCGAGIMMNNDNDNGWEPIPKPVMNLALKFTLF